MPRTTLDLAATRPGREVERAWNETEVLELTDVLSVPDLLLRYPGRPGSALLRSLAGQKTRYVGRTRNELEEAFLALIDESGLPRPRMNAHLALRDRFFEVDCLWEDLKVAIELDGGAVHRTTKAFHNDRERDRILTAERWTTTRVTWQHIEETRSNWSMTCARSSRRTLERWTGSFSTISCATSRDAAWRRTVPSPALPEVPRAAISPAFP